MIGPDQITVLVWNCSRLIIQARENGPVQARLWTPECRYRVNGPMTGPVRRTVFKSMFDHISVQAKNIEKDVYIKDLKNDVSSLLENSIMLTGRIETLKNTGNSKPIKIELVNSHGKIILVLQKT